MSGFRVMATQCDQCLFGPNRIVTRTRMSQLLKECSNEDRHFICHKATIAGDKNVCCRGFYDKDPYATNLMRIAARLGVVRFDTP